MADSVDASTSPAASLRNNNLHRYLFAVRNPSCVATACASPDRRRAQAPSPTCSALINDANCCSSVACFHFPTQPARKTQRSLPKVQHHWAAYLSRWTLAAVFVVGSGHCRLWKFDLGAATYMKVGRQDCTCIFRER